MVIIQREDEAFWTRSFEAMTSGTGHTTRDRTKFPHMWTSDRREAVEFTAEEADIRIKYLKRYWGIDARPVTTL